MMPPSSLAGRWSVLFAALLAVAIFVVALHSLSPRLPGPAGELFRRNIANQVETTALIYSESGDIRDYLDEKTGRYCWQD